MKFIHRVIANLRETGLFAMVASGYLSVLLFAGFVSVLFNLKPGNPLADITQLFAYLLLQILMIIWFVYSFRRWRRRTRFR